MAEAEDKKPREASRQEAKNINEKSKQGAFAVEAAALRGKRLFCEIVRRETRPDSMNPRQRAKRVVIEMSRIYPFSRESLRKELEVV